MDSIGAKMDWIKKIGFFAYPYKQAAPPLKNQNHKPFIFPTKTHQHERP